MSARTRAQRYRAKLHEQHCRRVEVWVEGGLVDDLRRLADYRRLPLRLIVREALQAILTCYGGVLAVMKKYQYPCDR